MFTFYLLDILHLVYQVFFFFSSAQNFLDHASLDCRILCMSMCNNLAMFCCMLRYIHETVNIG